MREINKPYGISTPHPLTHRSTAISCHSLTQRQLPQLPNASHDQPDYNILQKAIQMSELSTLKVKKFPKMKIPTTPETVKNFLEDAGLNFHKYYKLNHTQKKIIDPPCLHNNIPLIKPSDCMSYDNRYTFYNLKMALWSHKRVHGLD